MKVGIFGKKVGMTQIYNEKGALVPVTVIDASNCVITQIKKKDTDGYSAIQVGQVDMKPQNASKPEQGHFKKAGTPAKQNVAEIKVESDEALAELKAGATLKASMFVKGDKVDVTAKSKGRGFAGVMKRHGFHGTKASHGVHEFFRHGGSIGATTWPGRVLKNTKMPGQYGNTQQTIQNLEIVDVNEKENLLLIKGAVPGSKSQWVFVQSAKKRPAPKEARAWT